MVGAKEKYFLTFSQRFSCALQRTKCYRNQRAVATCVLLYYRLCVSNQSCLTLCYLFRTNKLMIRLLKMSAIIVSIGLALILINVENSAMNLHTNRLYKKIFFKGMVFLRDLKLHVCGSWKRYCRAPRHLSSQLCSYSFFKTIAEPVVTAIMTVTIIVSMCISYVYLDRFCEVKYMSALLNRWSWYPKMYLNYNSIDNYNNWKQAQKFY